MSPTSTMIAYRVAVPSYVKPVVHFFHEHRKAISESAIGPEFLCSIGLSAAVRRGEVIVASSGDRIVGAIRIYRRKTVQRVSVYQFAIQEAYRGLGIFRNLLAFCGDNIFEVKCKNDSLINEYFYSTGWVKVSCGGSASTWRLTVPASVNQ
jgi:hypothetical protein